MSEPPMLARAANGPTSAPADDCWNEIGVGGDRSCPELNVHVHCRNCPKFASAARAFFDRPAPPDYLEAWTSWLARADADADAEEDAAADPKAQAQAQTEPGGGAQAPESRGDGVLIFRLGREWLAFRTRTVVEVALPRPVHRIPHRAHANLSGLVNLRGRLQLCFSLRALLGVHDPADVGPSDRAAAPAPAPASGLSRLIVLRDRARSEVWAFAADEVHGVERVARSDVQGVPSTLANPAVSFSQAIIPWNGRSVGFLDEQRVFDALRSIGQ